MLWCASQGFDDPSDDGQLSESSCVPFAGPQMPSARQVELQAAQLHAVQVPAANQAFEQRALCSEAPIVSPLDGNMLRL